MSDRPEPLEKLRSSRQRYRRFVQDYKHRRLDEVAEAEKDGTPPDSSAQADGEAQALERQRLRRGKRREYLREYFGWLWPHRYAVAVVFVLALIGAGLNMIEPLFMRFIIDHVLLASELDQAERLTRLHLAGGVFLGVIVFSNLIGMLKDYRQRLLNTRVMLALRR